MWISKEFVAEDGFSVLDACLAQNAVSESVLGKHAKLCKYQVGRERYKTV